MPDQQLHLLAIGHKKSKTRSESTVISDESVELQDLSLVLHPSLLEKKPSLSLLSIESSSRSEEGRGDQQMSL